MMAGGKEKREGERRPTMKYLFDASVQPEMKSLRFHLQCLRET